MDPIFRGSNHNICMYVYFTLLVAIYKIKIHSKYLQQLTIIRVKGTLGKGLRLLGLKQEKTD